MRRLRPAVVRADLIRSPSGIAAAAGLRTGDRIVSEAGEVLEPVDRAELVHRLRGRRADLALDVIRDHAPTVVRFPIRPHDDVLARRDILLAGALIAPSTFEEFGLFNDRPRLMVHYVILGSEAEGAGIALFDHVLRVNGRAVASVDALAGAAYAEERDDAEMEWNPAAFANWERFTLLRRAVLAAEDSRRLALRGRQAPTTDEAIGTTLDERDLALKRELAGASRAAPHRAW